MIPFKHQNIIYTCAAIPFFIIRIIKGPEVLLTALYKASNYMTLFAQDFLLYLVVIIGAFGVYRCIQLTIRMSYGECVQEEMRILVSSTIFMFIVLYRYSFSIF
jgi:hypothetical protein